MRYKCICSYDGSSFYGFQIQNNYETIQKEIERVLKVINKEEITIHPAGRTDKGVHARAQVFHFDANININPNKFKETINRRINKAIYIESLEVVEADFHSRKDSKSREYHYLINFGKYDPLLQNYQLFIDPNHVDIPIFMDAFSIFVGEHDFRSFTKSTNKENTVRTIYSIDFEIKETLLTIKIHGNGFLHNQVRILVAMALEVGMGKLSKKDLKAILGARNRVFAPKIVAASGLYLFRVNY